MARGVPDEQIYRPELSAEDLPRKHLPEERAISIGPGLDALGGALQQKYEADTNTYAGNQLANLRLQMTKSMEDAKQSAKPGADGYTSDVLKQFDDQAKQYTQQGGANGYVSRAMQPGLQRMREQFGQTALEYEAQAGVQYREQSARDSADKLANIASAHPDQAEELTGQALSQVNGSKLSPDVTLATARYAQSAIAKSAVNARIQADPYATMTQLLKPETADATIQGLRPDEREELLTRADAMLHQRVADTERLSSMQDKQERENASAALTGMIVKSQSADGLNMQDVLKQAALFRHDPAGLEAAMNLASGKSVETDAPTFLHLFQRAQGGEDVSSDVFQHVGKDLSKDDAQKLLSLGDRGVPNAHQQGIQTIDGIFKQGVFDKYDPEFNTRHMNAVNDYWDWAKNNPGATAQQATTQAMGIAKSYAQASFNDFSQTAPMPRFAVGNRINLNPDATAAATLNAEKAGTISHDEAVKQMGIIAQWRSAIERVKPQAQPTQ